VFALQAAPAVQPSVASDQPDVIEVVGRRTDQALKIDRRIYRVNETPHSEQKDAVQLLRGLPGITISPEEDISLLGSGNLTIFVDGRPYVGDSKAYLRGLHGSDIERIEIITNPSAQYSAEGTGGIINFVIRRKQSEGVSGSASAQLSNFGHANGDATVKTKHGKWTYELHASGATGTWWRAIWHRLRSDEVVPGGIVTVHEDRGRAPIGGTTGEASAKLSYEIDPRTSVSTKIYGSDARSISTSDVNYTGITPDFASFSQHQRLTDAAVALNGELNFDHKGKKDGEALNASLRVFGNPRDHEANSADFGNGTAFSTDKQKRFLFANGQVDWQHPMLNGEILSAGGVWNYSRMRERYGFTSAGLGGSLGSNAFDQFEAVDNHVAGYVTFQQPIGTWTLMSGLRVERDARQILSPGRPTVEITETDAFPTLHVQHALGRTVDLSLSYSKRVDRPQLNDLRPYPLVQDIFTIKLGNPLLKDQSTDSYEINLHYHLRKIDAGVIVYDRETSRLWTQTFTVIPGTSIFTAAAINSGHSSDRGAEFDLGTPVVRRVKVLASLNLFDQRIPAGTTANTQSAETFRYTTNGTLEWDGPERGNIPGDVAQLQWTYTSPWRQFQIYYLARNQLSFAYTHSFSRTVSLTVTAEYWTLNKHQLVAPLVQEYYSARYPTQFNLRLLKTFGKP
jgi:outer membrane receptor for ferrienterochelin and colicin